MKATGDEVERELDQIISARLQSLVCTVCGNAKAISISKHNVLCRVCSISSSMKAICLAELQLRQQDLIQICRRPFIQPLIELVEKQIAARIRKIASIKNNLIKQLKQYGVQKGVALAQQLVNIKRKIVEEDNMLAFNMVPELIKRVKREVILEDWRPQHFSNQFKISLRKIDRRINKLQSLAFNSQYFDYDQFNLQVHKLRNVPIVRDVIDFGEKLLAATDQGLIQLKHQFNKTIIKGRVDSLQPDGKGNLFVATCINQKKLLKLDQDLNPTVLLPQIKYQGGYPNMLLDGSRLLITAYTASKVLSFDIQKNQISQASLKGSDNVFGLARLHGNIFVSQKFRLCLLKGSQLRPVIWNVEGKAINHLYGICAIGDSIVGSDSMNKRIIAVKFQGQKVVSSKVIGLKLDYGWVQSVKYQRGSIFVCDKDRQKGCIAELKWLQ